MAPEPLTLSKKVKVREHEISWALVQKFDLSYHNRDL